jgi:uncharacterized paraquat-inducible protein A
MPALGPNTQPPQTCDCGYNLAGLNGDPETKCPECGLLMRDIKGNPAPLERGGVLAAMMLSPAIVAIAGAAFVLVLRMAGVWFDAALLLGILALTLFVVVSTTACISIAISQTDRMGKVEHAMLAIFIIPACAAVNFVLVWIAITLVI